MKENNIITKNSGGFTEFIVVAVGLALLLTVPYIYSLRPPANSELLPKHSTSSTNAASFSLADN